MTVSLTARPAAARRVSPVLSALYLIVVALFVARLGINQIMLNLVMNYSLDGGNIVEKFHPSFYGLIAVTGFALLAFRAELDPWETSVLRRTLVFSACCIAMLVFAGLRGNGGSAGFLVDNYVMAGFATLLFLFPPEMRQGAGKALLVVLIASAGLAIVEFALKTRLLPFSESEAAFRPTGLSSHPLTLGLWCAVAIPLTAATDWSRAVKTGLCAFFYLALAASGARTALLGGSVCMLLLAIAAIRPNPVPQRRLERRMIVALAAAVAVPLVAAMLYAAGALQRFQGGIVDKNAAARVVIYQVFDGLPLSDILFGFGMPAVTRFAVEKLHLVAVESAVVVFVAIFGAVWSVIFVLVFAWASWGLLRGASAATFLAMALFIFIGASSNGLATREPPMLAMWVFILAFRRVPGAWSPPGRRPEAARVSRPGVLVANG